MEYFRRFPIPSLEATLNVFWETVKAYMPDNSPCMELMKTKGDTVGVNERNPFRNGLAKMGESTEMATMAEEGYEATGFAEDGFISRQQSYQQSRGGPSMASVDFSEGGEFCEGGGKKGHRINEWQAAWNVTNAIQGMFIVSLPFAVLRGGYWAIFAMIGIAHICCYTGKILVDCLYELDLATGQLVRVRDSYVSIAKACFGKVWGARIVNIAQIIELLMTCILYVVVCGDLLIGTFPEGSIDTRSWMMLTGIVLIPLGFLKSLKMVSVLSFWCTMSHLFINAIILGYCLLELPDWGWGKVKWSIDMENFPISLGVIVFSYTSQIFLPTLEGSMIDPSKFSWMLNWSHIAAAAFKSLFGYLCFLTFQDDTQQALPLCSIAATELEPGMETKPKKSSINSTKRAFFSTDEHKFCIKYVFLITVIKALLSYPLPYYAACELLEKAFFRKRPNTLFPTIWAADGELKVWGLAFKVGVIVFTVLMAISIPHFAILMGFIGSFTGTMLSFIWPCYFHLKLKRDSLDKGTIYYDCFVIFLGVLFGVVGVYDSGSALIKAFEIGLPF